MTEQVRTQWNADTILAYLHDNRDTLREFGVQRIGLFGSYARGEQTETSDMDFLVALDTFSFKPYARLWNFLEDSFGVSVDLVPEEDLRSELRPYVLPEVRYVEG